jgi:hypothetical protein
MLPQLLKSYDEAMKNIEDQIKQLGDDSSSETKKQLEESLKQYKDAKDQLKDQFPDEAAEGELTDEKIEQLIESSINTKRPWRRSAPPRRPCLSPRVRLSATATTCGA